MSGLCFSEEKHKPMTSCGLKENAPKNLALPDNIFFSENVGPCPGSVFLRKNKNLIFSGEVSRENQSE
jgi:hypothetical protein